MAPVRPRVPAAAVSLLRLFGLSLESELDLAGLPVSEGTGPPDVRLRLTAVSTPRPPERSGDAAEHWFGAAGDEAWFDWPGVARVRIADGATIELDAEPDVHAAGLRSALLGPVFTVLLLQRGLYPLHAAAVVIDGRAVAVAADSGAGKSTLALALADRGHRFLGDDVAALATDGAGGVRVAQSYPQLKLLPDLLAFRGERAEELPLANPVEEKRARPAVDLARWGQGERPEGWPLARVLVLEDGADEARTGPRLAREEAFFALLRHGHRGSLHSQVVGVEEAHRRAALLAERVPVHPLRRPRDLARLDELCAAVERAAREEP